MLYRKTPAAADELGIPYYRLIGLMRLRKLTRRGETRRATSSGRTLIWSAPRGDGTGTAARPVETAQV